MSILEQLVKELGEVRQKHTTPTGTPSTPYMYGPNGLFGVSGLERDVISTRVQPRGLAGALPAVGTTVMDPLFPYITGFVAASGSNPSGVCDDGPTAGPIKNCIQTAAFGRYTYMTRELELNRLGQQTNRGEFQDLRLVNDPLLQKMGGLVEPNVPGGMELSREVLMRFVEVGVAFQNKLARQLWTANPANNSLGGGYAEFPGLDILIGTTKVDAITGATCPSLRSDVKDFNYVKVDANSGFDLVNTLTYMMRYLTWNADRMNMNPVDWAIVMRPGLFYEITAVWPCSYLSYRCAAQGNDVAGMFSMTDAINLRDAMRSGSFLRIDGVDYPVVLDDGIVEESAGDNRNINEGCFASDIYVIPLRAAGMQMCYWQYLNYSAGAMQGVSDGNLGTDFWTDGGRYLWHKKPPLNWCVQWISKIEPRVILHAPHLAGRLNNVQYCPLQHTRDSINTDDYWVDGGVTSRSSRATLYSDWNLPGPS